MVGPVSCFLSLLRVEWVPLRVSYQSKVILGYQCGLEPFPGAQPVHWSLADSSTAMAHLSVGPKLREGEGTQLLTDFSHYEESQACLRTEQHPSEDIRSLAASGSEV